MSLEENVLFFPPIHWWGSTWYLKTYQQEQILLKRKHTPIKTEGKVQVNKASDSLSNTYNRGEKNAN